MTPLAVVLAEACAKFRPVLDPRQCGLSLAKRPLDLSMPFRLANIPTGSRLDLIKGAVEAANVSSATVATSHDSHNRAVQDVPSRQPEVDVLEKCAGQTASTVLQHPLGADRSLVIYTDAALQAAAAEAAAEAAAAAASTSDPPDDFFELDVTDFAVFSRSMEAKKKAEGQMKTASLRDAEDRTRAGSYGPVRVRVHLPDGHVVEAQFAATEGIARVQEAVHVCLVPELRSAAYLYTTPPKALLKDGETTLYKAGLVPAAHVHCGIDETKAAGYSGPLLCPEALGLVQHTLKRTGPVAGNEGEKDARTEEGTDAASQSVEQRAEQQLPAPPGGGGPSNYFPSTTKVPKWLKLGNK